MKTSARYLPGIGIEFIVYADGEGFTFVARDDMTITFIEHRVKELVDFLS